MNVSVTLLLLVVSFALLIEQPTEGLIFEENFEVYNFASQGQLVPRFSVQKLGQSISSEIPACEGTSAVRFHVDATLSGFEERRRSMLMMLPHPDNHGVFGEIGNFDTTAGEEFWYGFAIYVPNEWDDSALVWQQKAGLHYANYGGDKGVRTGMNPTLAVYIDNGDEQLRWKYLIKADPQMIPGPNNSVAGTQEFMGPVRKGAWNTFVIHVNYTHNENGFAEFWVDQRHYRYEGRTVVAAEGFRDAQRAAAGMLFDYADPYNFSFGIYKPELGHNPTEGQYTLYFDAFRVGDKNSNRAAMQPRCGVKLDKQVYMPLISR